MVALHRNDDSRVAAPRATAPPHLRLISRSALPRVRIDALPDHTDYRDTGCEVSPQCQLCPLERCKDEDETAIRQRRADIERRDREIALIRRKYRAPIMTLAHTYGVSRRTVFRILREQGASRRYSPQTASATPVLAAITASEDRSR